MDKKYKQRNIQMDNSMIGSKLVDNYKHDIKKEWKYAFFATFLIGLLIHFYKFSNTMLNHDSVFNYYHSQNIVGSGRWLLSAACALSSFFDLPWITGILSLVYISLTVVIIIDLFEVKNPVVIGLTGGLLVSFPAVTGTLFFGFTADGYFLSMLLAAIAARLQRVNDKKISHLIISMLLICCSCGIYQAYVSFAIILLICHFILYILNHEEIKTKDCFKWIGRQIINFGGGLGLYFIIWKICLKYEHFTATSYQGINELKFSFGTIISAIPDIIKSLALTIIEWNVFEHGWTVYGILNVIFLLLAAAALVFSIVKTKLYRQRIKFLLVLICCAVVPFAAYMWRFTSESVEYGYRMLASLFVVLAFILILADKYYNKILGSAAAILLALIIFNNGINANISYFYLDKEYKNSYAQASEMISRIHEMDTDCTELFVVGNTAVDNALDDDVVKKYIPLFSNMIEKSYLYNDDHFIPFFNNTFSCQFKKADPQKCVSLLNSQEIKNMGIWPAKDSIQIVDDIIVIKISDTYE